MSNPYLPVLLAVALSALSPGSLAAQNFPVTFTSDIAPIIFANCTSCHRAGGGGPFSLLTYEEVRRHAMQIAQVTKRRYMPPWKPVAGFGTFAGERRLTDAQVALIQEWVNGGSLEGAPEALPVAPRPLDGWHAGHPDLVVTMPQAYELAADGSDVFRTFAVSIPIGTGRYVKGIEIRPGAPAAVHHATLKIDRTRSSRLLDVEEDGPGYDGGAGRGAVFPDGHFLGWTPGQLPYMLPDDMAWRLEPGSDLVLELHMMPTGKREAVQVSVGLFFTDQQPLRPAFMLRLGSQAIDIPAGDAGYSITDTFVLPVAVEVLGVQPHAHNLAREIKAFARLPDGTTQWLVYISDWDFRWQDVYRYRKPLPLPEGTTLSMEFTYDNSAANIRNPSRPPKRVTFGQTTASEMGNLWVQVAPRTAAGLALLRDRFAPKLLKGDIEGYEKMLESAPTDARAHADLAFLYLSADRPADAIVHLEEALRLTPDSPSAHYALGTVLLTERRLEDARRHFSAAIRLKPDFAPAHNNLGIVNHAKGDLKNALANYTEALRLDPNDPFPQYNRGRVQALLGNVGAAIDDYDQVLQVRPDDPDVRASLAGALASQGRIAEAIAQYRRTLVLAPDLPAALLDLAWILATADRSELKSAAEAVGLAERVATLTGHRNAAVLETLAVAYFAAGRITDAIDAAQNAYERASMDGLHDLAESIRMRLESYRQR